MADTPTTLSLITLAQEYRGDVIRQVNRKVVALKILPILPGAGLNVAWATEADGAVAETYSEGADTTNFGRDAQAPVTLNWGLYRSGFHVTKLAMDAASTTATPMGNRAQWARNLANASAKLAAKMEVDVFTGTGASSSMVGLDTAIGTDNNTYAGIDRTVGANAYWKPTVVDAASAPITLALIRDDIRKIYEACGENPDVGLCSPAVFNAVGNLFDATRRQNDQVREIVTGGRGKVTLDGGFQAIEFDGMFFVKDKDATANQIYYVNTNHVEAQYLPYAEMRGMEYEGLQADDGFGVVPLGFKYEKLAKLGASERAEIVSTLQLKVDRPNTCGVRKNVAA